jgi:hypothetical protein
MEKPMSLTLTELDQLDDILFNLPAGEISAAIVQLSPEARSVLKEECQRITERLMLIAAEACITNALH